MDPPQGRAPLAQAQQGGPHLRQPQQGQGVAWDRLVLTNLGFLPSAASSGPPALPDPGGPFRRSPLFSRPPRPGGEDGGQYRGRRGSMAAPGRGGEGR